VPLRIAQSHGVGEIEAAGDEVLAIVIVQRDRRPIVAVPTTNATLSAGLG
jgi:hypothetical protein